MLILIKEDWFDNIDFFFLIYKHVPLFSFVFFQWEQNRKILQS